MKTSKNILYYLIAIGLFFLFKFGYTISSTNDLVFLLKPTSKIIELLTGSQSVYLKDGGYFYQQLNILIDKSCSGFNFWLLCSMMLIFLALKKFNKPIHKTLVFILSFILAYIFTVLVNSSRIFVSIIIQSSSSSIVNIYHNIIHESLGILTNLTFLILIYLVVERTLNNKIRHEKFA